MLLACFNLNLVCNIWYAYHKAMQMLCLALSKIMFTNKTMWLSAQVVNVWNKLDLFEHLGSWQFRTALVNGFVESQQKFVRKLQWFFTFTFKWTSFCILRAVHLSKAIYYFIFTEVLSIVHSNWYYWVSYFWTDKMFFMLSLMTKSTFNIIIELLFSLMLFQTEKHSFYERKTFYLAAAVVSIFNFCKHLFHMHKAQLQSSRVVYLVSWTLKW